jgi:GST-like protein
MSNSNHYEPPSVWTWDAESGGKWASVNRPIAGPTHEAELPRGKHPLQIYSMGTLTVKKSPLWSKSYWRWV